MINPLRVYESDRTISALARVVANAKNDALNIITGAHVSASASTGSAGWVDAHKVRLTMPAPQALLDLGLTPDAYRGLLDHEAGHARFSEAPSQSISGAHVKRLRETLTNEGFNVGHVFGLITPNAWNTALNILEDARMERALALAMPGAGRHIAILNRDAFHAFNNAPSRAIITPGAVSFAALQWWSASLALCSAPGAVIRAYTVLDRLDIVHPGDPRLPLALSRLAAFITGAVKVKTLRALTSHVDAFLAASFREAVKLGAAWTPEPSNPQPPSEPGEDEGEATDGQDDEGEATDGQDDEGEATDGQDDEGEATDGQDDEGEATDGQDDEGEATDGQDDEGEATDGQDDEGEATDGQDDEGEATDGQDDEGEATDAGPSSDPQPERALDPGEASTLADDVARAIAQLPEDKKTSAADEITKETREHLTRSAVIETLNAKPRRNMIGVPHVF